MVRRLEAAGVDLIELSGGTYEQSGFEHKSESTTRREGYFTVFADQITPHVKKSKICVTGGFRNIEPMAKAISEGTCHMIGLARPLCAEPDLVQLLLAGRSTGARENKFPAHMQTMSAILQIHCFAEGRPIYDLSQQSTVDDVMAMVAVRNFGSHDTCCSQSRQGKKPKRPEGETFDYPEM
jgi:hypothetical protein